MTPTRAVAAAFALSALASVALVVVYVIGGNAQIEGVLLALALGGIGAGIVVWAIRLLDVPIEAEEHESLASTPEQRSEAVSAAELETLSRRRFLVRLLLGAGPLARPPARAGPLHDRLASRVARGRR